MDEVNFCRALRLKFTSKCNMYHSKLLAVNIIYSLESIEEAKLLFRLMSITASCLAVKPSCAVFYPISLLSHDE